MRKFNIMPKGIIHGGKFQYSYDPQNEAVSYRVLVEVKKLLFKKTIEIDGQKTIEAAKLESDHYRRPGSKIEIANLTGTIVKVDGHMATARVHVTDIAAAGTAVLDLSGKYVDLESLYASGQIKFLVIGKIDFQLVVKRVVTAGMMAKKDITWPIEGDGDGTKTGG